MSRIAELMRKGSLVELQEQLAESEKKIKRLQDDVVQYTFPTDTFDPVSNDIELALQAMKELAEEQDRFLRIKKAIKELGG